MQSRGPLEEGGLGEALPYLDCSMREAPSCLRWALIESLELGGLNYLPTNWQGFAEYFKIDLRQVGLKSAEDLVTYWVDRHPSYHRNTLQKVLKFARDRDHRKLLEALSESIREHLQPEHQLSGRPAECFRACEHCCNVAETPSPGVEGGQPEKPQPGTMDHLKNSSPHDKAQPSSSATFSSPVAQANTINCSGSVYIWVPPSPSPSLRSTRGSSHPGQEKDERARHVSPPCTVSQPLTPQEPPSSVQNADDRSGTRTTSHVEDVQGKHSASVYVIKHVVEAPQPIDVTSPAPMASEGSTTLSSEPTVGTVREQAAESPSYKRHVCSENQPRQRQHPQATEPPVDADGTDHLHDLGVRLFNTWPYLLYRLFYRHFTKDIIRLLFAVFIAYQLLTTVLVSMCERGGFRLVFQDLENTNSEILHRLVMFCLRLCIRVVTPVCLFQPSVPTVVPTIPRTGLSGETARIRLLKAYRLFSPPHETHEVKISSIARAFSLTERILKRQITTAWVVIVHSVLLVALLYYLGVFFLIKDKLVMKGVCNFSGINTIVFRVPLLNISMHLLVFLELISIFVIVLLICLTKELYCYENKIAVYAVITLGAETTQLYRDIRKRWEVVDYYCYAMPLCLLALLTLSICTGKVFTPSLSQDIEADDIANWYFWIVVLSGLTFLATSPNRMFKFGCLIGYALVGVFIGVTDAKGMDIPAAGSSVMILLFISLAVIVFNLLFTLWRCHLHHWREKRDRPSYFLMLYCFISLCALPAMVAVTMCREVFSLSQFLHTCYIRF